MKKQTAHKILELKGLQVRFKNGRETIDILTDLNMYLEQGKTTALIGESGSGKSICALTLLGLLPSYVETFIDGEVLFYDGTQNLDLLSISAKEWNKIRGKRIGMIFQDPNNALNPIQKCGIQILEAVQLHTDKNKTLAKERVYELLSMVGLDEQNRMYASYPHQLSGGQLQRILIAIALAGNPKLLIADEPTTNLDVVAKSEIVALMLRLKKELDLTILYITHDLKEAEKLADKFYGIKTGKITSAGDIDGSEFEDILKVHENSFQVFKMGIKKKDQQLNTLLEIRNVSKTFNEESRFFEKTRQAKEVLNDLSFNVNSGEILGLIGASGSGKTTLGRVILNLEKADKGEVRFRGTNILNLSGSSMNQMRQKMQIVYQNPYNTLNPRMRITDLVLEPLRVHGLLENRSARKEAVDRMLDLVGIEKKKFNHYTFQLSGGQRQRVAIARALIMQPEFVVLDECISSLDRSTQIRILELLFQLKEKFDLSYLFISHDRELVFQIADNVLELVDGRIIS